MPEKGNVRHVGTVSDFLDRNGGIVFLQDQRDQRISQYATSAADSWICFRSSCVHRSPYRPLNSVLLQNGGSYNLCYINTRFVIDFDFQIVIIRNISYTV